MAVLPIVACNAGFREFNARYSNFMNNHHEGATVAGDSVVKRLLNGKVKGVGAPLDAFIQFCCLVQGEAYSRWLFPHWQLPVNLRS
jgi:hypothetical protein